MQHFPLLFHSSLSYWFLTFPLIYQKHFWILIKPPSLQPWWADTFIGFINVAFNPLLIALMTIFTSNRRERLLQNSLLSSRFDNLLVFSISPCSQKVISQGSVLASILLGAFCQWKYLMTWWGDYLLHYSPQRSCPELLCSQKPANSLPSAFPFSGDCILMAHSVKTQPSLLITLHMQPIALISRAAQRKPNHG